MLDETLVVCMAEFGRSPRLDGAGGRNHWGSVFSVALAGGGIKGGQVFGASDKIGAQPREGRVRPEDLSATIFHCLGHRPGCRVPRPPGQAPFPQPGRGSPSDPLNTGWDGYWSVRIFRKLTMSSSWPGVSPRFPTWPFVATTALPAAWAGVRPATFWTLSSTSGGANRRV